MRVSRGHSCTRKLIDFDRIDGPVCTSEVLRIVSNEIDTSVEAAERRILRTVGALRIDVTGPSPTEIGVDNDAVIVEVGINIAALKQSCGLAKLGNVWCSGCDATWNTISAEEPDLDVV